MLICAAEAQCAWRLLEAYAVTCATGVAVTVCGLLYIKGEQKKTHQQNEIELIQVSNDKAKIELACTVKEQKLIIENKELRIAQLEKELDIKEAEKA